MEDSQLQLLIAVLGSGAVSLILKEIFDRLKSWRQGHETRKRSEIDKLTNEKRIALAKAATAEAERDEAYKVRDEALRALDIEASLRRRLAEGLSDTRRFVIDEYGARLESLPDWPI